MVTQNITLDGTTAFTAFGQSFGWSGSYIERASIGNWGSGVPDQLNFAIGGTGWRIRTLQIDSSSQTAPLSFTLTDATDGVARRIDALDLSDHAQTTITLHDTRIRQINGGFADTVTLFGGNANIQRLALWDSLETHITLGSGSTDLIYLGDGDNHLTGGSGWIGHVEMGEGTNTFVSNGGIGYLRASGTNDVTLNDGADALVFSDGNSTIRVNAGFVGTITGYDEDYTQVSLTIGADAQVRSVGFSQGREDVTVEGGVEQMLLGAGDDSVTVQEDGWINSLFLGDGDNVLVENGCWVGQVKALEGNDIFQLFDGHADQVDLGAGDNQIYIGEGSELEWLTTGEGDDIYHILGQVGTITVGEGVNQVTLYDGARVSTVIGAEGDDIVTMQGDARVLTMKLDGGANVVTTDRGHIESYYSWDGDNTLNIGAGGIGQITIGGEGSVQRVVAHGFVGTLQVYGDSASTVEIDASAVSVMTGLGNDAITLAEGQWIGSLRTWEGRDVVTLGAGSLAEIVSLDQGNDLIRLNWVMAGEISDLRGEGGTDTIDLGQLDDGVTFTLDSRLQGLGEGKVIVSRFENLTGTGFDDRLEGNRADNLLKGGRGQDRLSGLAGDDVLDGGAGRDVLTGGEGEDTFVFGNAGQDKVTDFVLGEDLLLFRGATALSDLGFEDTAGGVRISLGAISALVLGHDLAEMQAEANFLFA